MLLGALAQLAALLLPQAVSSVAAQPDAADALCADVRYLMQRNITPYDLNLDGGVLQPGELTERSLQAETYAAFFVMNVTRPVNEFGTVQDSELTVRFSNTAPGLEFAVFRHMVLLDSGQGASYQAAANSTNARYTLTQNGIYTLVIRRAEVTTAEEALSYTVGVDYPGGGTVIPDNIRDDSLSQLLAQPPQLSAGWQTLTLPSAGVRLHVNAATSVASQAGQAAQIRFGEDGLLVGNWAETLTLLGGDLAARGPQRLFYLENYGYRANNLEGSLGSLETSNGARVITDWQSVRGLWMTETCVGVRLEDGHTLTAPVQPDARAVTFNGTVEDFDVRVNAAHSLDLNWYGVADGSEIRMGAETLEIDVEGGQRLSLEAAQATLFWRSMSGPELDIGLPGRGATLALDWDSYTQFTLTQNTAQIAFASRGIVTRDAEDIARIEALAGVVQMVYQDGRERLLLPASEDYLEIVSPAGQPDADGLALPGEAGFLPRSLNNLGGECYAVNTLLEVANCPPNGFPNPANGNLWYAVTDLSAHGYRFDLNLTRSYNSRTSQQNGAFGYGWTSAYRLDYAVPYDADTGARTVLPTSDWRVGLDLTWAPRGLVNFTTPSGSQHQFVQAGDAGVFLSGSAITMPGWTLTRDDVRAPWRLRQSDGFTYRFDRAGRLSGFGYPDQSRMVAIRFADASTVEISDAFEQRQITLYYDADRRITRSVLQDNTATSAANATRFETSYRYTDGFLTGVTYSDGQQAVYGYDSQGRMTRFDDPRAPVSPSMQITYTDGGVSSMTLLPENTVWRVLSAPVLLGGTRAVTVTDDLGNLRTYTYALAANTGLREAGDGYTLISVSSPLTGSGTIDALPMQYRWTNGLLTQIDAISVGPNQGRNSTQFVYTSGGQLQNVGGALLGAAVEFDANGLPVEVSLTGDGTTTYSYDTRGFPQTIHTAQGGRYDLHWNASGWLETLTRQNDGVRWQYSYNALGLVTRVTSGGHTVSYTWDGLGRLARVDDPLLGSYRVDYSAAQTRITDDSGVEDSARYDGLGRLVETQLTAGSVLLRRSTYTYDTLNRLTSEAVWVGEAAQVTAYAYAPVSILPAQPGDFTQRDVINGYSITRTDPLGRRSMLIYDALDRLRQQEDIYRRVTRYDYFATDTTQVNGLRIVQRDIRGRDLLATTTYQFDARGQLRDVRQDANGEQVEWRFSTEGDPTGLRFLEAIEAGLRTVTWNVTRDAESITREVVVNPIAIPLASDAVQPTAQYAFTLDFLGRPTWLQTAGSNRFVVYCPQVEGGHKVVIAAEEARCAASDAIQVQWYDARDRLTRVDDPNGTRTLAYRRDGYDWIVDLFTSGDDTPYWSLRYNAAGDLVAWTDETGTARAYTRDPGGRLRALTVVDSSTGEPDAEASLTFSYNALNLLTEVVNGLGHGTRYQYDERGLVIVEQELLTADATTYAYDPYGAMTSLISPLGSTTSFLYENTRLTGVVTPKGIVEQFGWEDTGNALIYTDGRGSTTRYTFDGLGALWRVDDAAGRVHELHYDGGGTLREWLTVQPRDGQAARTYQIEPDEHGISVREASQPDWEWHFGFSLLGQLTQVIDPNGTLLTLDYAADGRLRRARLGDTAWTLESVPGESALLLNGTPLTFDTLYRLRADDTTRYHYTPGSRGDVTLTLEAEATRTYLFSPGDDSARPRTVTLAAAGQSRVYVYNAEGLIEEIRTNTCTAPDLGTCDAGLEVWTTTTRFIYDAEGRPARIIDAQQNVEIFDYDDAGNLITYQGVNGRTYTYAYDALNRMISVTGPTGLRVLADYNALDRVVGLCRTRNLAISYEECAANSALETYETDSLGRLTSQSFPNNTTGTTTLTHDYEGGRLRSWGLPDAGRVTLAYDGLAGLAREVALGTGTRYALTYTAGLQLEAVTHTTAGTTFADRYQYDRFGRVEAQSAGDFSLAYTYAPDNRGFMVEEARSGAHMAFLLDDRGMLAALDYGLDAPDAIPLLSMQYRAVQAGILSALVVSNDGFVTQDFQLDGGERVQNMVLSFEDDRLLVDYILDALGRVNRQRIDGIPLAYFEQDAGGYITVTGYDDNERLATMRVNDKASGQLLYVLTFTYNAEGLRDTETRRYVDGTQVSIRYEYGTVNQLTRRVVTVTPGTDREAALQNGLPLALVLFTLLVPPLLWKRRRLAVLAGVTGLALMIAEGQGRTPSAVYLYRYDAAGNLAAVELEGDAFGVPARVCATYTYDSANRLIAAVQNERQYRFEYDVHQRLVGVNNWRVVYAGEAPVMAYNRAGLTAFYGRTGQTAPLFIAEAGRVRWLTHDGRSSILSDAAEAVPLRLLDPLLRVITLNQTGSIPPTAEVPADPCLPERTPATSLQQPVLVGMLWEPQTNLYFADGRAYLPDIGMFLQRDPHGPSVYGSVYDFTTRDPIPTQHRERLEIAHGLETLQAALQMTSPDSQLTDEAVEARYAPSVPGTAAGWSDVLLLPTAAQTQLARVADLPSWLHSEINRPGVQMTGLSAPLRVAGSPSGTFAPVQSPLLQAVMPTTPRRPQEVVQLALALPEVARIPASTYNAQAWLPRQPGPQMAWSPPLVIADHDLNRLLAWLPQPFTQVMAVRTDLLRALETLPDRTALDWLRDGLRRALPALPQLPPTDADAWRMQWFDFDTFALGSALARRYPVPPAPYVPVYAIGPNPEWLFLR